MAKTSVITLDLKFQGREMAIAAYAIPHSSGVVLVECGPGSTLAGLEAALMEHGYGLGDVTHVLLTHIHLDHAGAAGRMAREGAHIYVHPVGAPHLREPDRLLASAARIYGDRMDALWGEFLPVPEGALTSPSDLEEVAIGELRFLPINTPGHAEHHYAYLFEDLCFTGDIGGVRIPGFSYLRVPMPPPELHLSRWRDSLARLRGFSFARIAPTHFGIFDDPEWQLAQVGATIDRTQGWLEQVMPDDPPIETLRQQFTEWMEAQARGQGLSEAVIRSYELANPVGMSADGLRRYWSKVLHPEGK
jgi:glyoxylase-like metal-dependent hydrolase (beta-lactamase superfamily II)